MACLIVAFGSFTGCVSTHQGLQSSPVVARNVSLDPIKADLQVDETTKLKGESSAVYFLFFRVSGENTFADGVNYNAEHPTSFWHPLRITSLRMNRARAAAAYKAMGNTDYDLLVSPRYTSTYEDYFFVKKYKVKVEGYGAKYKNFRTEKQKIVVFDNGKEMILQDK